MLRKRRPNGHEHRKNRNYVKNITTENVFEEKENAATSHCFSHLSKHVRSQVAAPSTNSRAISSPLGMLLCKGSKCKKKSREIPLVSRPRRWCFGAIFWHSPRHASNSPQFALGDSKCHKKNRESSPLSVGNTCCPRE